MITLTVNGRQRSFDGDTQMPLTLSMSSARPPYVK